MRCGWDTACEYTNRSGRAGFVTVGGAVMRRPGLFLLVVATLGRPAFVSTAGGLRLMGRLMVGRRMCTFIRRSVVFTGTGRIRLTRCVIFHRALSRVLPNTRTVALAVGRLLPVVVCLR
ncbi:hypothetical protein QQ44_27950 [Mycolicibacterium setense]|uniref:Uncharacterized protein n=1 Tax=Mycolicibacterium setense TaxID=431269 RepID=A0ABR4YNR3_9MYCO|nr:hypothetical protein QQ44_27950 [Mycolicibacterium setense]